jgi:hypothetical protein
MADINWGYGGGVSAGEWDNVLTRWRERKALKAAAPDIAPALAGDKDALARVTTASPDIGMKLALTLANMDARRATQAKAKLEIAGRLSAGVLSAPPDQQPALYAAALEQARSYGLDTSQYPQTWSPAAKAWLDHNARMIGSAAQIYKRMSAGQGGGGGGAPAGGGWTNPGPTAAPVRTSGAPAAGPVVASAVPPPSRPPPAGQPGQINDDVPSFGGAIAGAPQAPPAPQMAGGPPMPPAPIPAPARPAAAPAPTQMAAAPVEGGGIPDDAGEGGGVFAPASKINDGRLINLPDGAEVKVSPKDGKPIETAGKIYLRMPPQAGQTQGALVMFDPAARKVYAAHDAVDRIVFVDPDNPRNVVGEIRKGLPPRPDESIRPTGQPLTPRAAAVADAWSLVNQLAQAFPGAQLGKDKLGQPAKLPDGGYIFYHADGTLDVFRPKAAPPTPANYEPVPGQPGTFRPQAGGPADPVQAKALAQAKARADAKPIPPGREKEMTDNLGAIQQVDRALALLEDRPDSIGGPGSIAAANIPGAGMLQNRIDKSGTDLRAIIANIGSLIIHQRSGAAVTASEFPRLRPFIPTISDDPETARKKLQQFRAAYLDEMAALNEIYSPEGGYRSHGPTERYLKGAGPSEYDPATPGKARSGKPAAASPANGPPPEKPGEKPPLVYDPATGKFK